jgi:hypothetical protein
MLVVYFGVGGKTLWVAVLGRGVRPAGTSSPHVNDARRTGATNAGQAKAAIVCGIVGCVLAVGLVVVNAIMHRS